MISAKAKVDLATLTLIVCLAAPLQAQIVNGDFGTGDLSGWTVIAEDQSFAPVDAPARVVPVGDGFAAQLSLGAFHDGTLLQLVEQSFSVEPSKPLLQFDILALETSLDESGTGDAVLSDELFVTVGPNPLDQIEPVLVDRFGVIADPIGTASGLVDIGPSHSSSGLHGVTVDLSRFAGKEVVLSVDSIQQDDGYKFDSLIIGNFSMRPVPEPASSTLLCIALCWLMTRRRNRAG